MLAIGTQGNPNKLRCPGADHPMITPQLDDPEDHIDKNVVVVGTGDAGIENALGLATDPALGNTVTILNRGTDFAKAKICLLYTSPSPRDRQKPRMPSSA